MLTNSIIGSPEIQADFLEMQIFEDNCAVCAEMSIINQFLPNFNLSQEDAAYISAQNGWYMPGEGTALTDIGNFMNLFGIENHTVTNATLADLASELQLGHGVIVGVNAGQLWETGQLADLKNFICKAFGLDNSIWMPADHAITVTGLDMSDPTNPQVIINDSGVPNGAAVSYPLDKFIDAWENSNFYYTATNNSLPSLQKQGIDDNNFWGDFEWSKWFSTSIGVGLALSGVLTGDIELLFKGGILVEKTLSDILNEESFARTI